MAQMVSAKGLFSNIQFFFKKKDDQWQAKIFNRNQNRSVPLISAQGPPGCVFDEFMIQNKGVSEDSGETVGAEPWEGTPLASKAPLRESS